MDKTGKFNLDPNELKKYPSESQEFALDRLSVMLNREVDRQAEQEAYNPLFEQGDD